MRKEKNELGLANDGKDGLHTVSFCSVVFLEDSDKEQEQHLRERQLLRNNSLRNNTLGNSIVKEQHF